MCATDNRNVTRLTTAGGQQVILIGTAHVSRESVTLVKSVIEDQKPDTVCVELCSSRYEAIVQQKTWQDTDIIKVIKEKKAFLLLSNLLLASFQKRIAKKLDVKPGAEMLAAIESGQALGAHIHLADRDIRVTLSRTWRSMRWTQKIKLLFQLLLSFTEMDDITAEDVEKMKEQDMLESILAEVGQSMPQLKKILIDERDRYLAYKIRTAPGQRVVAAVGAGHVPGIVKYWETPVDVGELERIPPPGKLLHILKWVIPLAILTLFGLGFLWGGSHTGAHMLVWWVVANGVLAGLGAVIALAHPLTILSSVVAAPLTSLNPMIAAGWVSGLVEAFTRRPKVRDFERLPEDILSVRGFWRNNVTRILLVVVFTNIGSSLGTFVAIPLIVKLL